MAGITQAVYFTICAAKYPPGQWAVADSYALNGAATASHYFVNYGLARDAGRRVTVRPCVLRAAPGARCCCGKFVETGCESPRVRDGAEQQQRSRSSR